MAVFCSGVATSQRGNALRPLPFLVFSFADDESELYPRPKIRD